MTEYTFHLDGPIPSKKNRYRIQYAPAFYSSILHVLVEWRRRKKKALWIGPDKKTKDFQKLIAWKAKAAIPESFKPADLLAVEAIYRGSVDLDNLMGAVLDGFEQSGRIPNDRQVKHITLIYDENAPSECIVKIWKISQKETS